MSHNISHTIEPIFALATSSHRSALHVHRLSGAGIFEKLLPYLYPSQSSSHLTFDHVARFPHTQYVHMKDEQKNMIDDVVITFYRAPKSFTGEDLIEITCHGNPIISQKIQSFFRGLGFRDAAEGEFTSRAFLNGKLDLAQAEAIRELIHAETFASVQLSRHQLDGHLSHEIAGLREKFLNILSYLEAHIDFSTDEVGRYEPTLLIPKLNQIFERLHLLKDSYINGIKLKEGIKIVICGSPNAGKSTLYNALLRSDRAIVTHIAGTTRDVLTERLVIENRDFVLIDTAGLRHTKNKIEKLGIERSMQAIQNADIICAVIDGTKSLKKMIDDSSVLNNNKVIFVVSKKDILPESKIQEIQNKFKQEFVFISKDNILSLQKELIVRYDQLTKHMQDINHASPILISARTYDKVKNSLNILQEAFTLLQNNDLPEKIASCLYCALKELEEILGEVDMDNIYKEIFSTFCIGK